jgi:hypothetical protein
MSIANLAAALVKAQADMASIKKDEKNPFFKSSYASLNAVREVALPACNKHGISVLQPTVTVGDKQYVKTTLLHSSGEMLDSFTEVIVKSTNDAQQAGSGISYARRYGLMAMLCLASDDDDAQSAVGKPVAPAIKSGGTFNKKAAQATATEEL